MSELITKLNPALVAEALQAPAVIYKKDSIAQVNNGYTSHIYDSKTRIGIIILSESILRSIFSDSTVREVQLMNMIGIDNGAFKNCTNLGSITIPNGVTWLGQYAFQNCTSLKSVNIPNSVTSIGRYAFDCCSSLTSVTIPNSVTSIKEGAFYNCRSLTSVIIPDSVTSIKDFVFWECGNLKDVVIPDSVTEIGECAFFECGLTSVTIPKHVTYISDGAFNTCSQLSTIYCKASTPPDTIEDAGCLPYNSNLKIYIPINSLESYKNHEYWQSRVDALIETVFEDEVLESGTNIKTINGNSILGSGDITIEVGSAVTSININGQSKSPSSGVVDLGYVNKQLSTTTSSSMTLSPNVYYRNTSTSLSTLTITLGGTTNNDIINEYFVEFTTRDAGTTVSLPNSIKWANGVAPTFENGKTYQISIVNNLGTCVKFG